MSTPEKHKNNLNAVQKQKWSNLWSKIAADPEYQKWYLYHSLRTTDVYHNQSLMNIAPELPFLCFANHNPDNIVVLELPIKFVQCSLRSNQAFKALSKQRFKSLRVYSYVKIADAS